MFTHMFPFNITPNSIYDNHHIKNSYNHRNSQPNGRHNKENCDKIKYSSIINDYLSTEERIKEEKRKQYNLRKSILKCVDNSIKKKFVLNFRKYSKTIQEYEYPQNYICINCPEYAKLVMELKGKNISLDTPPIYSFLDTIEKFRIHYYPGKKIVKFTTH